MHLANRFSRQIRPPIYSLKQTKLRRRRVIRYAILYFFLLVVFVAVMVGPVVAGKYVPSSLLTSIPMDLVQPGTCLVGACPGPGGEAAETGLGEDLRRFMAY
jgi:1,3-beta-glucan synthase